MFASTPERPSLPAVEHRLSLTLLPPLSLLLNEEATPFRPKLPSIDALRTPQTPFLMFPSRSQSTSLLPAMVPLGKPHLSVKTRIDALETPRDTPSVANTSMDSEADTSAANDSMIKPASKRKAQTTLPSRDFAFISHSPATYPSQEPSIDNASLARRKRRRTSPHELLILNQEFVAGSTPNKARRVEIAHKVNMTEKAVQIWFQNKRQSLRRLKSSDKEITELPPTPNSSTVSTTAPTPLVESTPIKPQLVKLHSQNFVASPAIAQLSPIRSYSTSSLTQAPPVLNKLATTKMSVYSKILAVDDKKDDLVLSLTNKKQPEFARQSLVASTQVMTFKLGPSKERRPLGAIDVNTMAQPGKTDTQCVQSLLLLSRAR